MSLLPNSVPNSPAFTRELQAQAAISVVTQRAILGNADGQLYVNSRSGVTADTMNLGLLWARLPTGWDGVRAEFVQGDTITVEANGWLVPQLNLPVLVRPVRGGSGLYELVGYDKESIKQAGKDVRQLGNLQAVLPLLWKRLISDGKVIPDKDSNGLYTQKFRQYPERIWGYDGTVRNIGITAANAYDLSAYYPSATYERYVLIYYDTVAGATGIALTDEQAIGTVYNPTSDLQTLLERTPHNLCIPIEVYRLSGNKSQLDQSDWRQDARQFITPPSTSAFPKIITRNYIIPPDHQQIVVGDVEIADGAALLLGDGAELIQFADGELGAGGGSGGGGTGITGERLVTTTATVTNVDAIVIGDASGGAFTITLPALSSVYGRTFNVKALASTNLVTVAADGSDVIEGAASVTISIYENLTLYASNAAGEWILL